MGAALAGLVKGAATSFVKNSVASKIVGAAASKTMTAMQKGEAIANVMSSMPGGAGVPGAPVGTSQGSQENNPGRTNTVSSAFSSFSDREQKKPGPILDTFSRTV